jgi:hypothetical protein
MANKIRIKMKKRTLITFFILFVFLSCSKKDKFKGYVYYKKQPLSNTLVREIHNDKITKTDSLGYFELKNSSSTSHLIFSKEGYKTDTVDLIRLHPISILFSRKQTDTLFMKKKE